MNSQHLWSLKTTGEEGKTLRLHFRLRQPDVMERVQVSRGKLETEIRKLLHEVTHVAASTPEHARKCPRPGSRRGTPSLASSICEGLQLFAKTCPGLRSMQSHLAGTSIRRIKFRYLFLESESFKALIDQEQPNGALTVYSLRTHAREASRRGSRENDFKNTLINTPGEWVGPSEAVRLPAAMTLSAFLFYTFRMLSQS